MLNSDSFIRKIIFGGGFIFDFAKWLVVLCLALTIIHFYFATIFIVDGASMDPTFKTGEIAILNKIIYKNTDPKRGDVAVVNYPGDPEHKRYVKRVIGLPNETVKVSGGFVSINNKKLIENYLDSSVFTDKDGEWKLGDNEYFLMGDNRLNSNDSRYFGPVEKRFIVGKTVWILLPRFFSVVTPSYVY